MSECLVQLREEDFLNGIAEETIPYEHEGEIFQFLQDRNPLLLFLRMVNVGQ